MEVKKDMSDPKLQCPKCSTPMNYHADKLDYTLALTELDAEATELGGVMTEVHTCPRCQNIELRVSP